MAFIFTLMLLASVSTLSLARPQVVAGSGSSATGTISTTISTISAICPPGTWSSISSTSGFVYSTVLICSTTTGSTSNGICSQISATNSIYGPGSLSYATASQTSIPGVPTSISTASSTTKLVSGTASSSITSVNTASSTALATAPLVTTASGSTTPSSSALSNSVSSNPTLGISASSNPASSSSASGSLISSNPAPSNSASVASTSGTLASGIPAPSNSALGTSASGTLALSNSASGSLISSNPALSNSASVASTSGTLASSNSVSGSLISSNLAPSNSVSDTSESTNSATSGSGTIGPISRSTVTGNSATSSLASASSVSSNSVPSSEATSHTPTSIPAVSSAASNSPASGIVTAKTLLSGGPASSSTSTTNLVTSSPASSGPASGSRAPSDSSTNSAASSATATSYPAASSPVPVSPSSSNAVTGGLTSSDLVTSNSASVSQATSKLGTSSPPSSSLVSSSRTLATTSSASSLPLTSSSSSLVKSSTSTTPTNSLSAVQAQDSTLPAQCTNGAAPDASCFNALDLPDYILNWYKTADCGSLGFADCFYAKKTNYAPSKCDQLNGDAACTEPVWDDFKDNFNGPEDFYVAWNIWNTNGFFLDMYTAIGDATQSCANGLAAIVALLDPPTTQNVVLDDILDALTFGLSLYAEGSILVKALLRSAPQTTGLLGKLFPSGTVDGEYQDWTVISQKLGQVTDAFRSSVADGLPLIQDNVTSFISWSQNSGLSGFRPPLNGLTDSMALSLNTYAISQIIQTQGIVVSRAPDTDVHALQTNGSKLNWNTGCSGGYTNGVCDTFFWDETDTYGLTDPGDFTKSYHDELSSMFQNLTTGQLLFTGARQCGIASGKNGGGAAAVNPEDPTTFSCLSNMQVCTWDESGYGPFVDCPNLPADNAVLGHFGVSGCIGSTDDDSSIDMPRAYLGPGVYQNENNVPSLQSDSFCDNIPY